MLKYHIQTIEVGAAGSASLSFSSIPQIYDELVLVTSLRDNVASGGWENAFIYPNNSSSNMVSQFLYGWSTNVGSGTNVPAVIYHQTARGNNTASTFSNSSVVISDYSKPVFKSILSDTSVERNDAAAINAITAALWSDTSPITSLTIVAASGAFVQYSSASLYGIKRGADGKTIAAANGGTVTTSGGYTYHTFTASSTFVANRNMTVEALVVGGGGSGGANNAAGGGAGGYLAQIMTIAPGSYAVTIGAGGAGGSDTPYPGSNTSLLSAVAFGGGRGGHGNNNFPPTVGGSGGGGGGQSSFNTPGAAGIAGQGNAGGTSSSYVGGGYNGAGGGGGGASAAGGNAGGNGGVAGVGGAGAQWVNSSYYAGGGGGGANNINSISAGAGGIGGGGNGGPGTGVISVLNGQPGTANTGGGGGGGGGAAGVGNGTGGAGGSGIVILRYPTPA